MIPYYINDKKLAFLIKTYLFFWLFQLKTVLLHFGINNETITIDYLVLK